MKAQWRFKRREGKRKDLGNLRQRLVIKVAEKGRQERKQGCKAGD